MSDLQNQTWNILSNASPPHKALHITFKNELREGAEIAYDGLFQDIEKMKLLNGWINPEIAVLYKAFTDFIELERGQWHGEKDGANELFWKRFRAIICCTLDEDSYYFLRFLRFLDLLIGCHEQFNLAKHRQSAYWHYDRVHG